MLVVKIALDAGHGMITAGKCTPDGEREWSFNNIVILAAQKALLEYEGVQILRLDDPTGRTDVPLRTRTDRANAWEADVLVSAHHNALAGVWGSHGGVETFVHPTGRRASYDLADVVQPLIAKAMGLRNRGVKQLNLHMVRESNMTAILTEGGFMDSTTDIGALRNTAKLQAQGRAIAEGLAQYYKLKRKVTAPKPTPPITPEVPEKEAEYLNLPTWQKEETANIYKLARDKGVFSSAKHEADVKAGKMTYDQAIFLMTAIAGAALNGGKRIG